MRRTYLRYALTPVYTRFDLVWVLMAAAAMADGQWPLAIFLMVLGAVASVAMGNRSASQPTRTSPNTQTEKRP